MAPESSHSVNMAGPKLFRKARGEVLPEGLHRPALGRLSLTPMLGLTQSCLLRSHWGLPRDVHGVHMMSSGDVHGVRLVSSLQGRVSL